MISSTRIHSSLIYFILVIITIIICTLLLSSSFVLSSTDYTFQNTIYHTRVNFFELLLPEILDASASVVQLQIGPNVTFMDGFEFNQNREWMIPNFGFMKLVNLTITDVSCHYSPSSKRNNSSSSSSFIAFDNFVPMALRHFTMKNVKFIIGDDSSDDALLPFLIDLVQRNYSIIEFGQAVLWSPAASNSNLMFFSNAIEFRSRGIKSSTTSLRNLVDENVGQEHGDFSFIRIPFNTSSSRSISPGSLFGSDTSFIFRDNMIDPFLKSTSKFRILGLSYHHSDDDFTSTTTTTTTATTALPITSTPNETQSENNNNNNRFALMLEETSSNQTDENDNSTTSTSTTMIETTSENPTSSSSSSTVPSTTTATTFSEQPTHDGNATANFTTSPNMTNVTTTETTITTTTTTTTVVPVPPPLPTIIPTILETRWIFYSCAASPTSNNENENEKQDENSPNKGFTRSQFTDFRTNFEHTVTSIQVLCESPTKTLHPHTVSMSSRTQSISRSYPSPSSSSDGNISSSKTFSKSKSQGLNKLYIPSKQLFAGSSALFVYSAPLLSVLGSVPLVYQNALKSLAIATVAECMYLSPKIDQQDFDFIDDDDENEYKKKFYDSLELEPDVNPSRMLVNPSFSSTIRDRFDSYRGSISGNLLILVGSLFLYLVVILIHSRTVVLKMVRNQDERRGTASSSFTSLLKTSITMLRFPGHWIASFVLLLAPATAFSIGALFALPSKNIKNVILDKKAPTAENGYDLYKERLAQLNPFNLGMSCLALFVFVGIAGVTFFFIYKKTKIDIVDVETLFSTGESDADTLRYDSYFQRPLISDDEREENFLVLNRKFEEYEKKSISCCSCCSSSSKSKRQNEEEDDDDDDDDGVIKESCCSKCMTYLCCCIGILSGEGETGTERDYHRELHQNRQPRQNHRNNREQPRNNLQEGNDDNQAQITSPTTSSALEKVKYTLLSFFSFSRLWSEQSLFKQRFGLVYECFSDCRFVILDITISFFINLIGGISVNCGGNDVCCRGGMFFVIVLIIIQMIFMTSWLWNPFLSRFFKAVYFFTNFLLLLEAGLGMGVLVAVGGDKEFDYSKTFFERYTVSIDDQRLRVSVVVMAKFIQAVSFVVLLILIGQVIVKFVMIFIRKSEERKQKKLLENEKKNKEKSELQKDRKTNASDESPRSISSSSSTRRPPGILKKNSTKHTNNNRLEDPLLFISSNNNNDDDDDDQQEMKSLLRLHTHQDENISSTDDEGVATERGRKRGDKKKHVTFYQSPNTRFENDGSQPFPKKPKRLSSSSPSSPRRKRRGQPQQQEQTENDHQQQPQPQEPEQQQTLVLLEQLRRTQEELEKFKQLRANERDQRLRDKQQRREEKQRHRVRLASDDCVVFVSPVASASASQRQYLSPSLVDNDDDDDDDDDEPHERAIIMTPSHENNNSDSHDDVPTDNDDDDELVQEFSQDDYNRLLFAATIEDENDDENLPVFGNREIEDDDELPEGEEMSLDELEYFTGVSSSSFKNVSK